MDDAAFLSAIRDHPDDDGPRLVYADWLDERGDPKGEFIRLGCQTGDKRMSAREGAILNAHKWDWLQSLFGTVETPLAHGALSRNGRWVKVVVPYQLKGGNPTRWRRHWVILEFRRGFVATATFFGLPSFLALVDRLLPLAPTVNYRLRESSEAFIRCRHQGERLWHCSMVMDSRVGELFPYFTGYLSEVGNTKHYDFALGNIRYINGIPLGVLEFQQGILTSAMNSYALERSKIGRLIQNLSVSH